MKAKERNAYSYGLKSLHQCAPGVLLMCILDGMIYGTRPFIGVYLSGLLIDGVYDGAGAAALIRYAVWALGMVFVLSLADSLVLKVRNRNMEYMYERQNRMLNKKSMEMDYEYLEDGSIHNMRESVTGFYPRFGLLGSLMESVTVLSKVTAMIVAAFVIMVPRLVRGGKRAEGFIGSVWCSVLFLVFILGINYVNTRLLSHYNEHLQRLYDEKKAPLDVRRKYYLDLFAKAESQKDVRMCGQEGLVEAELEGLFSQGKNALGLFAKKVLKRTAVSGILSSLSTILVYVFAGVYEYFGIITIGSVVSFAASIRRVTDAIFELGEVLGEIRYESGFTLHFKEFMNLKERKHAGTIPVEKRRDNKFFVEFDHVSFKYPGSDTYVIRDLDLSFVVGEKMAVVGKNGSGKTTFIKLLCRLYDVTEGCIRVNGIDIRKYDYREYCGLFAVVFQDFSILDFALGESVACTDAWEEERVWDALFRAGLKTRAEALPGGLAAVVGKGFDESGVNFSGGEKQKLAIARAIYKNAPFVIMDEPTAALDPEAETEVFEGFDRMVGKKTAIYISHRLASCRFCEDILVFEDGRVVQRGSHDELEGQDGPYRRLWMAQAGYYA